jgi:coatomer protein complex subunit gamma
VSTTFNTLDSPTLTVFENNLLGYSASCSTNPIDLQSIVNLTVEQQIKASHDLSPNEKLHIAPASDVPSSIGLVPELISYGEVFKSSSRKMLTEDETEYKISCVKHVYNEFIVFEFFCSNTIEDQTLADVSVEIEALTPLDGLTEVSTIPLELMPLGSYGSTFSIFKRPVDKCVVGKFSCTLKFTCKDVDPVSGSVDDEGYRDEYALEDLDLFISDYICSSSVKDFHMSWSDTTESHEESELTYTFPGSIDEATGDLKARLGFNPCVDNVESDASRTLCFAGEFADRSRIFIKAKLATGDYSCSSLIRLACRAPSRTLCQEVLGSFN